MNAQAARKTEVVMSDKTEDLIKAIEDMDKAFKNYKTVCSRPDLGGLGRLNALDHVKHTAKKVILLGEEVKKERVK